MGNPWEGISLEDYESHMGLPSVMQLQAMNQMMRGQLEDYPASTVMILGVAGGNGLEHIRAGQYEKIYGVDVNSAYLRETARRYPNLAGMLECLCVDLMKKGQTLPRADLLIANLLIEYIGYKNFQSAVLRASPKYVSCVIQQNPEGNWVSDSPYLHAFDGLEKVHHQIGGPELDRLMDQTGYSRLKIWEHPLPNGKKLVRRDYERSKKLAE